jgi:phage gpG-like protein
MANFTITADVQAALKAFESYGAQARDAVFAGVARTGYQALDHARVTAPKISTTLARSITLEEDREDVSVVVFTNVEYAAVIEFGFNGVQQVRQHPRTITQAFGRRIAPVTTTVTAHSRTVVRPAQPYMQPAADLAGQNIGPNILAELEALEL